MIPVINHHDEDDEQRRWQSHDNRRIKKEQLLHLNPAGIVAGLKALTVLTGAHYRGGASLVYSILSSLRVIDILFGISLLLFAVFCVVTRYDLARFRRQGPTRYLWVYGLSIILPVVYLIAVFAVLSGYSSMFSLSSLIPSDSVIEIIVYAVFDVIMIIVNKIYFDKRRHLFVN